MLIKTFLEYILTTILTDNVCLKYIYYSHIRIIENVLNIDQASNLTLTKMFFANIHSNETFSCFLNCYKCYMFLQNIILLNSTIYLIDLNSNYYFLLSNSLFSNITIYSPLISLNHKESNFIIPITLIETIFSNIQSENNGSVFKIVFLIINSNRFYI